IYSLIPLTAWVSLQLGTGNFDASKKDCQTVFSESAGILAEIVPSTIIYFTFTQLNDQALPLAGYNPSPFSGARP
ncbi:MAG: hypothetical protein WCK63_09365, partial [Betaproteobacteria bacterium]